MDFCRKEKESRPVLAICYDFDKTLSPYDMQAQGYIQSVGFDVQRFWEESNAVAVANDMDSNLAYMLKMVQEAEGNLVLTRRNEDRRRVREDIRQFFLLQRTRGGQVARPGDQLYDEDAASVPH